MSRKCVFVVEIGILHATQKRISSWDIWESFNTYAEAIEARNKLSPSVQFRVMKYFPAPPKADTDLDTRGAR